MEFKKCERCGAFFASNNNVCYNCTTKEKSDFSKFRTYLNDVNIDNINSLNDLLFFVNLDIDVRVFVVGDPHILNSKSWI